MCESYCLRILSRNLDLGLVMGPRPAAVNRTTKNLPAGLSHSMQQNQPRAPLPTASMTHLLLGPLNHLNSVSQQLFQSLSPPHTKPPPPPQIAALANADAALAAAVQLAHLHQKKQQRIEALKAEVLSLESSWRTVIMQLEEGRRDLEAIISEGDVRLDAIEQAKAGELRPACGLCLVDVYSWLTTGRLDRCHSIPGAPCIRTKPKRVYFCTTQPARSVLARPSHSTSLLPTLSKRGKNAPRTSQLGGTPRSIGRDPLCRPAYVFFPSDHVLHLSCI